MEGHGGATVSDHSSKPKKPKSRQVSSRFLSSPTSSSTDYGNQSPNKTLSPYKQKPRSSTDSRKHKSFDSGFLRGLWPASSPSSKTKPDTFGDHLGHERLKDREELKNNQNTSSLSRQKSCTEFSRFENEKKINYSVLKENHKPVPVFGGSMRYTGKFKLKPSNLHDDHSDIEPGRFSVDESSIRKKSYDRGLLSDADTLDSESEYSDICSGGTSFDTPVASTTRNYSEKCRKYFSASYMAPTISSRKQGIDVPSKFMHDLSSRSRRWSADSTHINDNNNNNNNSPKIFTFKKGNEDRGSSSGRRSGSGSPKMMGLSSSKPPTSPSRGKGVGNILSMGIELLRGKKSLSSSLSKLGPGSAENVHQLRLLHNRLIQWTLCNARAEVVNGNVIKKAERNLLYVWNGLIKLQHSVLQKRLQLQKQKLEMKLNYILHSQIKLLENWGNIERQHITSISSTKDYLHSVVCRIPLVDGAKVEIQSASISVRYASDLAASINWMLTNFSPTVEETVEILGEVAMVVTQEKLLLEECLELFRIISALEIQERSLMSSIMQFKSLQHHHHQQPILA